MQEVIKIYSCGRYKRLVLALSMALLIFAIPFLDKTSFLENHMGHNNSSVFMANTLEEGSFMVHESATYSTQSNNSRETLHSYSHNICEFSCFTPVLVLNLSNVIILFEEIAVFHSLVLNIFSNILAVDIRPPIL